MANAQTEHLVTSLRMARSRFLYGLDRVPDDRLHWSPGGSAKTPLQLAGKAAGLLSFTAQIMETGEMPDRSHMAPPPAPESREAAREAVGASFDRMIAFVESVTDDDLRRRLVPVPWGGKVPLGAILWFVPTAAGYLQGQLNYLQLAYGDEDPNIPPDWLRR